MFSDHHKPDISNASASQESNTSNPKKDMEKLSQKKNAFCVRGFKTPAKFITCVQYFLHFSFKRASLYV